MRFIRGRFAPAGNRVGTARATATARWAWELVRRTSAPARLAPAEVRADEPALIAEPFAVWAGEAEVDRLSGPELRGLERFLKLGGVLFVDDLDPERGGFGKSARRELSRALPDSAVVRLDPGHVVYKTFFMLDRPVGRVQGPAYLEAIVRGHYAQVIFSSHDLLGALARSRTGDWLVPVDTGSVRQREFAHRLAVNLAMYVLCSDYKDDAVHAPWLMQRRGGRRTRSR